MDEDKINNLIHLLNEKEVLLKEREIALEDQQEEFLSQKEELNAAVEELMVKNTYLTTTLEKLKQRNQELDDILYRASHDLKTPVSSIYGLIAILNAGPLSSDQLQAMTHLFQQMNQMEMRLTSMTNLSTAFFSEPTLETCSIQQLARKSLESIASHDSINLLFTNDDRFETDPTLFSIVLKCLLENSITYGASVVNISSLKKSTTIEIDVIDNGEGVASNIETQIFNMFYRGSERSKGLGVGLFIAKTIVEKMNGNIQHIPSGIGAAFKLTLPAYS
jgi:K+-sensing histidine kinase KdpD